MRKYLAAATTLLAVAIGLVASSPKASFFVPPAPPPVAAPTGYQGPGDIVSGAVSFYSTFRAYNAAYATGSNPNIDLCKLNCVSVQTINILTSGFLDSTTAATFCSTTCTLGRMVNQISASFADLVNTSNHVNDPTWATNSFDSIYPAATFNGSTQYVQRAQNVGPSPGYTTCALINWSSGFIITAQLFGANEYLQFFVNAGGVLSGRIANTSTTYIGRTSNSGAVSSAAWHHVCMTWDGTTSSTGIKLYVAGVQVDTTNDNSGSFGGPSISNIILVWGAQDISGPGALFNGSMNEFVEYPSGLSGAQITNLCNNVPGGCV